MKNVLLVSSGLILFSCAHTPDQHQVVTLPYSSELVAAAQEQETKRAPASLELDTVEGKSPRRVYFSALYHQYLTLSEYLHSENKIDSCPAFHHDKVETDEKQVPKVALYKAKNIDPAGKQYFPELVFNKKFSLEDHHSNVHQELLTLCEEGISDNYYKFDNLVTYYADKKDFHKRPGAMASVLKIPVYANYYLVKMLDARRGVVETHPDETHFIRLAQTHWFGKYVKLAHEQRDQYVKNRLVKR